MFFCCFVDASAKEMEEQAESACVLCPRCHLQASVYLSEDTSRLGHCLLTISSHPLSTLWFATASFAITYNYTYVEYGRCSR